jgi:hypothetical protein
VSGIHDYVDAHWDDSDGATSAYDQIHATALDLLRGGKAFFLSVESADGSVEYISAAGGESSISVPGFYSLTAIEAMRLAKISQGDDA